jgi:membrane-bound metal-dependent hydrolase YbcI (DUF457 family)
MQGPSHLVISWFIAEASPLDSARDRRIVAWAGLAPDVDALAYVAALIYYRLDKELAFERVWSVVHHRYTHGLAFIALTGIVAFWLCGSRDGRERARVAMLAMLMSALHNFLDVVAGGPTWPIYPLWPVSDFPWHASWSWTIGEWPNVVVLVLCLGGTLLYGKLAGRSPMECFGDRADQWMVRILQQGSDSRVDDSDPGAARARRKRRIIIWTAVILATVAILVPLGFEVFG